MAPHIGEIRLEHERDAAWLIALYLAIHGGDPAPTERIVAHALQQGAVVHAMTVLSEGLDADARGAVQRALAPIQHRFPMKTVTERVAAQRLDAMAIHIKNYVGTDGPAVDGPTATGSYCMRFQGQVVCVQLPTPRPQPHA